MHACPATDFAQTAQAHKDVIAHFWYADSRVLERSVRMWAQDFGTLAAKYWRGPSGCGLHDSKFQRQSNGETTSCCLYSIKHKIPSACGRASCYRTGKASHCLPAPNVEPHFDPSRVAINRAGVSKFFALLAQNQHQKVWHCPSR